MDFKETLLNDIEKVFINVKEFSEKHTLNDREIFCIIDEDKFQKKQENNSQILTIEGIVTKGMTLFISKKYLSVRPYPGEVLDFDGKEYTVAACKESFGLIELDIYLYDEIGENNHEFY